MIGAPTTHPCKDRVSALDLGELTRLMMVDGHDQPQVLTKIWHSSFVDQYTSLELSGDAQTFGVMGGSQQTDSQLTD